VVNVQFCQLCLTTYFFSNDASLGLVSKSLAKNLYYIINQESQCTEESNLSF